MDAKVKPVRIIDSLRQLYPGKWRTPKGKGKGKNRFWIGEHFRVIRVGGKFTRSDTGEVLDFPVVRKGRNYPVNKVLTEKLGGHWEWGGSCWIGEHFNVMKTDEIYIRDDTGETLDLPQYKPTRTHFISNILEGILGGEWVKAKVHLEWYSEKHEFYVYQSNVVDKKTGKSHTAYRRSDNKETVYVADGRKFYD